MSILEHFPLDKAPYEHQRDVLLALEEGLLATQDKKFLVLRGPTGSGKSAIAVTLAKKVVSEGGKVHILASHRFLQDQYMEDFRVHGLKSLWGKANYPCDTAVRRGNFRKNCSNCLADEEPTPGARLDFIKKNCSTQSSVGYDGDLCQYIKARKEAVESNLTLNNYSSFLAHANYAGSFGERDLLIVDEAHLIESRVSDFVSVEIKLSEHLEKWHVASLLDKTELTAEEHLAWLETLSKRLHGKILYLLSRITRASTMVASDKAQELVDKIKEDNPSLLVDANKAIEATDTDKLRVVKISSLADKVLWLATNLKEAPRNWVFSIEDGKALFRPVVSGSLAHKYLFKYGAKVLLMSATIDTGPFLRDLGIRGKNIACFLDVPSTLPLKDRPFLVEFCGSMSRSSIDTNLPKVCDKIKDIMERHGQEKGIIHCHSFANAAKLRQHLSQDRVSEEVISPHLTHKVVKPKHYDGVLSRILWHDRGDDLDNILEEFFRSENKWLVSPSVTEGLNGAGDKVRVQVLLKTPYASLGDQKVSARRRLKDGDTWYSLKAAQTMVQAYGRGCRYQGDWCTTYVVDSNAARAISKSAKYLPPWFMEAWGKASTEKWNWSGSSWNLRA